MAKPATKTKVKTAKPRKAATKPDAATETVEGAAAPKKARRATSSSAPKDTRVTVMHGETRITHDAGPRADAAVAAIGGLVDEIHALGRVRITSAAHSGTTTTLHAVLPDHPQPYEQYPGLILSIDAVSNLVSFDHIAIGVVSSDLVDAAATEILGAMQGDDLNPANAIGRRADWFERAVGVAETLADRNTAAGNASA